jgi:hypothetical protein
MAAAFLGNSTAQEVFKRVNGRKFSAVFNEKLFIGTLRRAWTKEGRNLYTR